MGVILTSYGLGVRFTAGKECCETPKAIVRDFASGIQDVTAGLVKFRYVCRFTSMACGKRHEDISIFKKFSLETYPR